MHQSSASLRLSPRSGYTLPETPQRAIELRPENQGFAPYFRGDLQVVSDGALRVDVESTLNARKNVVVTESAEQVETASTQVRDAIAAATIASIPVTLHRRQHGSSGSP
jgi:hypothetical protein